MPDRLQLAAGWRLCATAPAAYRHPQDLPAEGLDWIPASAPSTVAAALRAAGLWSLDDPPLRFDGQDWWYRLTFASPPASTACSLVFDGLATIADVWLNGEPLLSSDNMFVSHRQPVRLRTGADNELHIAFRSLDAHLARKRPRPRWKVPMIENQQLRWVRTTLLGRTPGWSPPCPAVGPWRAVWLEPADAAPVSGVQLTASVRGEDGVVTLDCAHGPDTKLQQAQLIVAGHGSSTTETLAIGAGRIHGELRLVRPRRWWPHTHGEPALYAVTLRLISGGRQRDLPLGRIGFRSIELNMAGGDFALSINGVPIFCRGACWTPLDVVSLQATPAEYASALRQVVDAGMNMLRLSGTMTYESDAFHDLCDELGILIWQDFMFANMDFPAEDSAFAASASLEVGQALQRLQHRPSLTVLCGNSEVEQQAAMWGAARDLWDPALFSGTLSRLATEYCPDVPFWPSSAHGGAFPHDVGSGTTSYYGVGAYLEPLHDARRAGLRFATECLAFANLPEDATLDAMPDGRSLRVHHAAWKNRVPRELGPGWDFEDVRDHYLEELLCLDARALRHAEYQRYLTLSRAATHAVFHAAAGEWRGSHSACRGALVWFLRDLWPAAGWGVIAADGIAKSPYYALRRVWQPIALFVSDEGNSGLHLHLFNDTAASLAAVLRVQLYRDSRQMVGETSREIRLDPRSAQIIAAGDLFDHFLDLSYAFRFGPPGHDVVVASLYDHGQQLLAQHCWLPLGMAKLGVADIGLQASMRVAASGNVELEITTQRYAHAVTIDAGGYRASDQYFDLPPGSSRTLQLRAIEAAPASGPRIQVRAMNSATTALALP